jgi:hypothetical protein
LLARISFTCNCSASRPYLRAASRISTARIRELNDEFRSAKRFVLGSMAFGQVVITRSIEAKGNTFVLHAFERVRTFDAFTKDNDPYGEHDFGSFEFDGENVFWKIDLYEREVVKQALTGTPYEHRLMGAPFANVGFTRRPAGLGLHPSSVPIPEVADRR